MPDKGDPIKKQARVGRREFNSDGARLSAESLLKSVEFECQEFLERAGYIDLQLMYQVLQYHSGHVNEGRPNDGVLADGFMCELELDAPGPESIRTGGQEETTAVAEDEPWIVQKAKSRGRR